jgi:hypothetical protein
MTYSEWRTTQQRLFETHLYSNVGISVEPAATPGKYNPVILTTDKTNDLPSIGFGLIKGAPYETTYLDYWDIAESGLSVRSSYRWNYNRRRAEAHLDAPLPVPGVLLLSRRRNLAKGTMGPASTPNRCGPQRQI